MVGHTVDGRMVAELHPWIIENSQTQAGLLDFSDQQCEEPCRKKEPSKTTRIYYILYINLNIYMYTCGLNMNIYVFYNIYIYIYWIERIETMNHQRFPHSYSSICQGTDIASVQPHVRLGQGGLKGWASGYPKVGQQRYFHASHCEDRNLHQVLRRLMWGKRSRFRRPGDGRHSAFACSCFFFLAAGTAGFFWPLLNGCSKKWNVGLGKTEYIKHCIFCTDQKSLFVWRLGCAPERSVACRHFGGMRFGIVLVGGKHLK